MHRLGPTAGSPWIWTPETGHSGRSHQQGPLASTSPTYYTLLGAVTGLQLNFNSWNKEDRDASGSGIAGRTGRQKGLPRRPLVVSGGSGL